MADCCLYADTPILRHQPFVVWKEIVPGCFFHVWCKVRQHAAVDVSKKITWTDNKDIRSVSGGKGRLELGSVHVVVIGNVLEFHFHIVCCVPCSDTVHKPFALEA